MTAAANYIIHKKKKKNIRLSKYLNFPVQLINVVYFLKNDINANTTIQEMTDIILINYSFIESDLCEVCTALLLFLCIPVTATTEERSFSKLKIIESYLRNNMNQDID